MPVFLLPADKGNDIGNDSVEDGEPGFATFLGHHIGLSVGKGFGFGDDAAGGDEGVACDRPVKLAAFAVVPEPVELCYLLCKGYIRPSAVTYLPCKGYPTSNIPSIAPAISTFIVAVPTFRYPLQSRYITAHATKYPSQPRYPLYGELIDVETQKIR